jgi:hypothetical protein
MHLLQFMLTSMCLPSYPQIAELRMRVNVNV